MNLRDEIIEHAKARGELYKWKIILVAGLGYAASGLVGAPSPRERACLLAFIPWVCIYTDLLCRDRVLKTALIGRFLFLAAERSNKDPSDGEYQAFASTASSMRTHGVWDSARRQWGRIRKFSKGESTASVYAFEVFALNWSTVAIAIGVVFWGLALCLRGKVALLLSVNSLIALVVSALLYLAHARRWGALQSLALPQLRIATDKPANPVK